MTKKIAISLLKEAEQLNPGKWISHSQNTALAAERIASACKLDSSKAYNMGLLHDIGRRFGQMSMRHVILGYDYLVEKGYPEHARICLTHSYMIHNMNIFDGPDDLTPDEFNRVGELLEKIIYNDYDRLIQLCDALGHTEGICPLETRICDVISRRGLVSEIFLENMFYNYKNKEYFEKKYSIDIYRIITMNNKNLLYFL